MFLLDVATASPQDDWIVPTFYPGTQSMALGKSVQVTPGATFRNIEFSVNASSAGRADNNHQLARWRFSKCL
jgi:hypothetical protein